MNISIYKVAFYYVSLYTNNLINVMSTDQMFIFSDAEKFCRKNVTLAFQNLKQHLVTAYTLQEKQVARENIRKRFANK